MNALQATAEKREVIAGRYELVGPIGHGGMGTVYRALQKPIDREVALKLLRANTLGEQGARAVRRFFKEARAIASLHHPNIISLYDFGQDDRGDRFLVMELLPGRSLADVLETAGPLPLARAANILDQVLDALQEAHRSDIVHRDLKPENIQIGRRGDREDFVTVLDFGIARSTDVEGRATSNTTIEVCGTPAYMSPEQILGTAVDPRSDLYSVGVLLFEMLTGHVPFESEQTIDVYMGHLKQAPPRLRQFGVTTPGLQELMDRLLAKSAEDRVPDAGALRRALRQVAGMPRRSHRPSTGPCGVVHVDPGCGFELVAEVMPSRSPGVDDLLQQWSLDVAEHGGVVRERRGGALVASFPGLAEAGQAIRAAMVMKQRTRSQRLSTLRPLYMRAGIHSQPSLAARLCEEAPRGGLVIGASCVDDELERGFRGQLRLAPAGELRIRGHRSPVRMLQLLSGR